ncbi:MAG: glycosyltransferase family 4 protein [Actinomycetota bacterium]|nr:glycosyltransferase family 4 protein [Actinomycetota bacterium]
MTLRVCVDARIHPGVSGGLEQSILGLAGGLTALTDGHEEYLFLVEEDHRDWLTPHLHGRDELLVVSAAKRRVSRLARSLARPVWHAVTPIVGKRTVPVPRSPGLAEGAGANVMHFTTQRAFTTPLPSIYQPWDLQYVHFPEFFTRRQRLVRSKWDREFCRRAAKVVVASEFGRREVVNRLGVEQEKIAVVPVGPGAATYARPTDVEIEATRRELGLPRSFALYPAQTWPHKNHLRLLEAVAFLRGRGLSIPVVCCGHKNAFYPHLARRAMELGLTDLVSFPGFVEPIQLRSLYALARAVIFPSLFEGGGMPVLEAFMARVPLACSNVTCLPEQVGDAALTFDPRDTRAIASSLESVWTEERLRAVLVKRGRERLTRHGWHEIARIFRAHYRQLGRVRLTPADLDLLRGSENGRLAPQLQPQPDSATHANRADAVTVNR